MKTVRDIISVKIFDVTRNLSVYSHTYKWLTERYINAGDHIEKLYNNGMITYQDAVRMALLIYEKGA